MTETLMINQLMIRSKNMMKLGKLQQQKRDDYTTAWLLDYKYFRDHYQLICCNLSQQKRA